MKKEKESKGKNKNIQEEITSIKKNTNKKTKQSKKKNSNKHQATKQTKEKIIKDNPKKNSSRNITKTKAKSKTEIKLKDSKKVKKKTKTKVFDIVPIKKHKKQTKKRKLVILIGIIILILVLSFSLIFLYSYLKKENLKKLEQERYQELITAINNSYNQFVITSKDTNLYDEKFQKVGTIKKDISLELNEINANYELEYFQIKDSNLYIKYDSLKKIDKIETDTRYKNYIVFNESVITNQNTKLYISEDTYLTLDYELKLPIIIKDNDKYYVEYLNNLVYVNKDEVNIVDSFNTNQEIASSVPILNYHFVINKEAGEASLCSPSVICHTDTQFDSHMKYISENNFYSITMKELEMFLDKKINLPKKVVSVTIDDGWFVARSIPILEKYNVMATLFLIGYLAPPSDYSSTNLEIHSHTWNLHNVSNCSGGRSPLLCYNQTTIIEDLKKSRESLNNTTYFCYPFYEYNNHAISALKEAGFTMALTGGNRSAKPGVDKFKVPRYVIYSYTTLNTLENILN